MPKSTVSFKRTCDFWWVKDLWIIPYFWLSKRLLEKRKIHSSTLQVRCSTKTWTSRILLKMPSNKCLMQLWINPKFKMRTMSSSMLRGISPKFKVLKKPKRKKLVNNMYSTAHVATGATKSALLITFKPLIQARSRRCSQRNCSNMLIPPNWVPSHQTRMETDILISWKIVLSASPCTEITRTNTFSNKWKTSTSS